MFSAQDNNSSLPNVPVAPGVGQTPLPPPVSASPTPFPPTPPQAVDTTPIINMPGKGSMGKKFLFLIPIILLLGTMVILSVVVLPGLKKSNSVVVEETPTPSLIPATPLPTAQPNSLKNWKEYVNRDAQLSFRYPPNLSLKELKTSATQYTLTLSDDASASATVMKIVSAKNTTGGDLLASGGEIDPAIKTSETDVDVSGIKGKQTLSTLISNPSEAVFYTLIEQDTSAYNFVWYAPLVNPAIYTQILGSVRFVTPGVTTDWQTYSNSRGSYSLRYPPAWSLNTSDQKASASAQTVSIRKNAAEAQFQNLVIQTTITDGKTKIELSASEIVSSIQNLAGWKETPTLDFRTIGGAQAEVLSGEKDGSWYVYSVMWFRNTLVEMSWRDTLLRQEQDNFNDILGSVKFK